MCKLRLCKSRVFCPRPRGRKAAKELFKVRATSYKSIAVFLLLQPDRTLEGLQSVFPRAHTPPQIHEWGAAQFTSLYLCSEFPALSKQLQFGVPSTEHGQLSEPRETKTWVLLTWGTPRHGW